MPTAPLRPCAGNCGALVARGRCPACARKVEQRRGSASARGYNGAWGRFRPQFVALLLQAGVLPVCGATLPTGPQTHDSQCKAQGRLNPVNPHFDHEPPLQDSERNQVARVCDPNRIQILCASCHARKSKAAQEPVPWAVTRQTERVVVCGPPGSGKSTWVSQHRQDGDLVWDLDAIASVLAYGGRPLTQPEKGNLPWPVMKPALVMRDALMHWLETTPVYGASIYVIVSERNTAQQIASQLHAQLVDVSTVERPQLVGGM